MLLCLVFLIGFQHKAKAQYSTVKYADSVNKKRFIGVVVGSTAAYATGLIVLNKAWYSGYQRSKFHFFNDNSGWLQIDKCGHAWSSYAYGIGGIEILRWAGLPRKQAIWLGGIGGTIFQTPIEILDGFSSQWGASPGDLIANSLGSAMVIAQELAWDEQRIQMKFSAHFTDFAKTRPDVLGENYAFRVLKDYNSLTFWLSVNPNSFGADFMPNWLNLSLGYGATGMYGANGNIWTDDDGTVHDYSYVPRRRQLYFSFDFDMQKIPVKNPLLISLFRCVNMIKVPAPTISYTEGGHWKFHPLYF